MLKKNDEFTAVIEELGCNGEGIAKIDGRAVFVPYALVGETVRLKILKAKSNYAFVINLIAESITRSKMRYFILERISILTVILPRASLNLFLQEFHCCFK